MDAVEASDNDLGYIYWKTHFIQLGGYHLWVGTTHSPHTQAVPKSVLKASTACTAFTACIEGPVTPYIHAVNTVDAVEAFNTDIGTMRSAYTVNAQ